MKRLFLASEFFVVADHIFKNFIKEKGLKVLFITTSSELHKEECSWVINDRAEYVKGGFKVKDFTITGKSKEQIAEAFADADIIHSVGGNTFHYLKQIQLTDSAVLYVDAVLNKNKIYVGSSAGSIITCPDISVKNYPGNRKADESLTDTKGLNLVNFIIMPHWSRKDFEETYLNHQMKYAFTKNEPKIILLPDNQYVRVVDDMYQVIDKND